MKRTDTENKIQVNQEIVYVNYTCIHINPQDEENQTLSKKLINFFLLKSFQVLPLFESKSSSKIKSNFHILKIAFSRVWKT